MRGGVEWGWEEPIERGYSVLDLTPKDLDLVN